MLLIVDIYQRQALGQINTSSLDALYGRGINLETSLGTVLFGFEGRYGSLVLKGKIS